MPIYRVKNASIIGVSSQYIDPECMFARALKSPLVEVVDVRLICEPCKALGVKTICVHKAHLVPAHIDTKKDSVIRDLMPEDEGEDNELRETIGWPPDRNMSRFCFQKEAVESLFQRPRLDQFPRPRFVFVAVDPAAGSDTLEPSNQSDLSIISLTERNLIVGLDSINYTLSGANGADEFIVGHLKELRKVRGLEYSAFVVGVEGNMGTAASRIQQLIRTTEQLEGIIFMDMYEYKKGLKMTLENKIKMKEILSASLDNNSVDIYKHIVSNNPIGKLGELKQQLIDYQYVAKDGVTKASNRIAISTLSGKVKPGKKDDLAVALQWGLYVQHLFFRDPRYRKYREQLTFVGNHVAAISEYVQRKRVE